MSFTQTIVVGYLGNDVEMRYTGNGGAVANFSVATSEKWTDKQSGEKQERTEWHRIVMFGKLAEIAGEYLRKGSLVNIVGKNRTEKYTDNNGVERYTTKIYADDLKMLGKAPEGERQSNGGGNGGGYGGGSQRQGGGNWGGGGQQGGNQPRQSQAPQNQGFDDDDIPF